MRLGLIGTGRMGGLHARLLPKVPDVEFAAVVGHDDERTHEIGASTGAKPMSNVANAIGGIDAAIVAIPAAVLAENACLLLEAGVPCLIEKPVVMSPAEYDDLNGAAKRGGTFYAVGLVEHFSPAAGAVDAALQQGGPPAHLYHVVRSNPQGGRLGDVDVVTDLLMHDLDHACRFLPGRVSGVEVSVLATGDEARCDHAAISLTFGRSGQADIILSRAMACPARTGTISRGDESFVMDLAKHRVTHHVRPSPNGAPGATHTPEPREMEIAPANPLFEEIQAFCLDAKAGTPSRSVSGEAIAPLLDIRWEVERKMAYAPALTNAV